MNISDAIRLFFRKVVRRGDPGGQVASGEQLWAMKREAQARDHELASREGVPPESMLLLRPKMLKDARIEWPDAPLNEGTDPERTPAPEKKYKPSQGPAKLVRLGESRSRPLVRKERNYPRRQSPRSCSLRPDPEEQLAKCGELGSQPLGAVFRDSASALRAISSIASWSDV